MLVYIKLLTVQQGFQNIDINPFLITLARNENANIYSAKFIYLITFAIYSSVSNTFFINLTSIIE